MAFTRDEIRESIERAGEAHWQALIRHHEDAYPASRPTPGDVTRGEADRLNSMGLGNAADLNLVESRVEQLPGTLRITHLFQHSPSGARLLTEPYTDYD